MKQIRSIAFIVLLASICSKGYSQVSLQTGAAEFTLPLFSYEGNDKLQTAVSLNYLDGNGLKVDEISSAVGTGWGLQCGGSIIREQRGLPDDQRRSTALPNPLPENLQMSNAEYLSTYFPNGYLFSAYNPTDDITNEAGFVRTFINLPSLQARIAPEKEKFAADREQDIFRLNFGKGTIEFVIEKNLSVTILNGSKVKVEFTLEDMLASKIKTCISQFTVTDLDGIKYIFSARELTQTCTHESNRVMDSQEYTSLDENLSISSNYNWSPNMIIYPGQNPNNPNLAPRSYVTVGIHTGNYVVTKWCLTRITNPLTGKEISFDYDSYDCEMQTQRIMTYSKTASVTILKQITKPLRLTRINLPNTGKVDFIYDPVSQVDVPNQKPLKEMIISDNNAVTGRYLFEYQYFLASAIKPYDYQFAESEKFLARLSLKSVQKKGNDNITSEPPYIFEYNINDPQFQYPCVPPMFSYLTDHWGYSNRATQTRNDFYMGYIVANEYPANRVPSYVSIKEECTHTTTFKEPVPEMAKLGIIKRITYPSGGSLSFNYEQNTAFFNNQNVLAGGVRVKNYTQYDGISHDNDISKDIKYVKEDGVSSSGWGYEKPNYQKTIYTWIMAQSSNNISKTKLKDEAISRISQGLKGRQGIPDNIISYPKGSVMNTLEGPIVSLVVNVLISLFNSPPPRTEETDIEYKNISYEAGNPLPLLYSRVELLDKINNSTVNGKSVFEYTSNQDLSLLVPTLTSTFYNQPRYYSSFYGLPKRTAVFDNTGFLQKESLNEYQLIASQASMSKEWVPIRYVYDVYPFMLGNQPSPVLNYSDNIASSTYYALPNHTLLKSSTERAYNKYTPDIIESRTDYTYEGINNSIRTASTYDSKGNYLESKYYYPFDYNLASIPLLQQLINNNIITTPVSKEVWQIRPGLSRELTANSVTEFGVATNGDLKPLKVYSLQASRPLAESEIGAFNANSLVRNSTYVKPEAQTIYDSKGNPTQLNDLRRDNISCAIYNDKNNPIASVANASFQEIGYTSFEAFSETSGNISTLPPIRIQQSPTGSRCGDLTGGGSLKFSIAVNKESILSMWVTSANILINGNSLLPALSGASINGWMLLEYNIPANTPSLTITGYGSCKIDEVRLYPKDARMSTSTYEAGKGKTSECDMNNKIAYYEYDGLGRLSLVRDRDRNIVKKICYNYSGQPEDCSTVGSYSNTTISHDYIKDNCGIGYTGTTYTYTVPAGTYTGATQAAADLLAANDIAANGQNQANLFGGCTALQIGNVFMYNSIAKNDCGPGYAGSWETLVVPANTYFAGTQAAADALANTYLANNLQSHANAVGYCTPFICSPSNCPEPTNKCINGNCEQGVRNNISCTKMKVNGVFIYRCTYFYCFSDGSHSISLTEDNASPCSVGGLCIQ